MNNVFTGKNGSITLKTGPSSPEANDATAIVANYAPGDASPVIGRATGIQVAVHTDLEEFHEIGHRHPIVLHPGNIHISGSIDRAFVSGVMLMLLLGRRALHDAQPLLYVQPTFGLIFDLTDPAVPGNHSQLVLDGVKFQNWGFKIPEDDFVMENITFRALTIHVIDIEAPAGGGAGVKHDPTFPAAT